MKTVTNLITNKKSKMKRKPKFLIVLASAAITFGILVAAIGKPPYAKHNKMEHCKMHHLEKDKK